MKAKKAKLPVRKIIGICLILVFIMSIGVAAANSKINNVKIILSNGYEMDVVTTKTKISDILDENHIILLPEENVVPNKDKELTDNNTIRITKIAEDEEVQIASTEETAQAISENIIDAYNSIVEKIIVVEEKIPFETIKKDVSEGSSTTRDTIVQQGKNGIKEVTYKVKYQNDVEIERTEICSKVIKEPVDKIVEVRKNVLSSRSASVRYSNGRWSYSDSEFDLLCAITAQECCSSYEGALAVITCACNRAESSRWARNGSDPLSQYMARGQFCYSIDSYWRRRLNGNYPSYVAQAVTDALNGARNHGYLSFRSAGYASGEYIGGNVYF